MIHTKVFATKKELEDIIKLARNGWLVGDTMKISSVIQGITKDKKTVEARETCHKLALAHGLPEIRGFYGIGTDGEFLKV